MDNDIQEPSLAPTQIDTNDVLNTFTDLHAYLQACLIGRAHLISRLMVGLLTGGHILIEGAPGLAKTRAIKLFADGLHVEFARIQCTPDLMPADLTGTPVFQPEHGKFEFIQGPVFHNLVMVDEINRAPPKVQSALLEAMGEHQVTVAGHTYALPDPFMVAATQNPIEHEGTFPLPEAQLDRFLLHVLIEMPNIEDERLILDLIENEQHGDIPPRPAPLSPAMIHAARQQLSQVHLAPALRDYIVRLVTATRDTQSAPEIAQAIEHPVSPRGSLALAQGAKALAWLDGRDYATPDDVAALAADALSHRIVLTWRAAADGMTARRLITRLADLVQPL